MKSAMVQFGYGKFVFAIRVEWHYNFLVGNFALYGSCKIGNVNTELLRHVAQPRAVRPEEPRAIPISPVKPCLTVAYILATALGTCGN